MKRQKTGFYEALSYLRKSLTFVYVACALFLASGIIAFLFPENFSFFDDWLRDIVNRIIGLSPFELILFIFQNNTLSALFALLLGVALGIVPIANVLVNGALLGYVFARVFEAGGISIVWRIVPHGIFELPAIMISIGLGIKLGFFIFSRHKKAAFIERFISSLNVFIYIIVPLLIIAAVIEGLLISFLG